MKQIGLGLMWIGVLAGCSHESKEAKDKGGAGIPVTIAMVESRSITIDLDVLGTVMPLQEAQVKVRVDGQIISMPGVEGEEVPAGTLLAQIDPRPYRAIRMQQEALVLKDQALWAQSKAELSRYQLLAKSGMASQDSLELAQTQSASLEATVGADRAAVDAARLQEEFTSIRAPFAGRLGLHLVDPGAVVHVTDSAGLFTISQMAPISVICSVPQDALAMVRAAVADKSGIQVGVQSRTHKDLAVGNVTAIDNHIDSASGQIQVRVVCANSDRALWPGAFVSVRLPLLQRNGLAIPASALERTQDGWSVFVVSDGVARLRTVQTGDSGDGWTLINQGLSAGERVVTIGQYRLTDGIRVETHTATASLSSP